MLNAQITTTLPQQVYRNSIPVVVLLVPVTTPDSEVRGLLSLTRGIEPGRGKSALPGGYVEEEVWQEAALRELREETGIKLDSPDLIHLESLQSVQEGKRMLIFCKTDPISIERIPHGFTSEETLGLHVIYEPQQMAFPAHTEAVKRFFESQLLPVGQEPDAVLRSSVFTRGERQRVEELAGLVSAQLEKRYGAGGWAAVDRRETIDSIKVRFNWRREGSNWGWSDYSSCTVSDGTSSVSMDYPDLEPSKIEAAGEDPVELLLRLLRSLGQSEDRKD